MKKILTILFSLPILLQAQTRLYMLQVVPPITSIAVNAAWNVTTGNVLTTMCPYSDRSTIGNVTSGNTGAAAVRKLLIAQFVSQPLMAQTLNCTLNGQFRYNMSSVASRTGEGFIYLRLVNADGTVASEVGSLTTTALGGVPPTNRTLVALTITSLSITAGQRLCIDVGWNYSTGSNTTTTGTVNIVDTNNPDLPVDNTTTTAARPWIEFSQTLKLQYHANGFF